MPISVRGTGLVTRALRGCAMQSVRTLSTGKWRLVKHRSTWFRPKPSGRPLLGFAPQALLLPWKSGWQKIHVACCSKATCHQKNTKLSNSIWRKTCRWLPKSQIHVFISNQAFQRMECGPTADHWDLPKQWNRWWSLPLLACLTLGPSADIGVLPSSPEWISSSVDLLPRPDHITPSMYSHHHFLLLQNSLDSEVRNFVPVLSADQVHFQWQLQPLFPSFPRPILSFSCHLTLSRGSSLSSLRLLLRLTSPHDPVSKYTTPSAKYLMHCALSTSVTDVYTMLCMCIFHLLNLYVIRLTF